MVSRNPESQFGAPPTCTHPLRNPRLLIPLLGLLLAFLLAMAQAHAETVVVAGTMNTHVDIADRFTVDIPGGLSSLTVNLPIPQHARIFGFEQTPGDVSIDESVTPDRESTETDSYGNCYRVLTYDHPREGRLTITVTQRDTEIRADLSRPAPDAPFPLADTPDDVAPYLTASPEVQCDDESIRRLARTITMDSPDEATAARRIAAWMSQNMNYAVAIQGEMPSDAAWALSHKEGSCDGWAHAFLALARASGIPARFAAGFGLGGSVKYPADSDGEASVTMEGHNQPHAWAELWYPEVGWVPYEPQGSAAFTDSHHLVSWIGLDCESAKPLLHWTGYGNLPDVNYEEDVDVTHLSDQPNLSFVSSDESPAGVILLARRQTSTE